MKTSTEGRAAVKQCDELIRLILGRKPSRAGGPSRKTTKRETVAARTERKRREYAARLSLARSKWLGRYFGA
jgi:hypothetical protein